MRIIRAALLLSLSLIGTFIIASPGLMRSKVLFPVATPNSPPVATDDNYTRHSGGIIGPLLQNDFDPDGDRMQVDIETFPTHGHVSGAAERSSFAYAPDSPTFTGTDSFTYKACDTNNACSGPATVTINIVNEAPVASGDSYTVHGTTNVGPMMVNDSDPDGDPISWNLLTTPAHGILYGLPNNYPQDLKGFTPQHGYTGPDSFTYNVCDQFSVCSAPATVNLSIVNDAPAPAPDFYVVKGRTIIGPFTVNDVDPDGDSNNYDPSIVVSASHGTVYGLAYPPYPHDVKEYVPADLGYTGIDTFEYEITDDLGASGTTTVTLYVLGDDDAVNAGACSACPGGGGAVAVGGPVNVTNGNMYLQQADYNLPSVGPGLNITRTYNSILRTTGLFGYGWSTVYDESITAYGPTFVRLNLPDGRAVYFTRTSNSAPFSALEKDFHGQINQDTDGSFTLTFQGGSIHRFNSAGKLLSLTDRYANQTTLSYTSGNLESVTDPFGRVLSVNTNANGQVISINDAQGPVANYSYGASNQLLSVTYADNSAFQFNYDENLRLTSVIDALGNVVESHTYDSQGRAVTSEKQDGVERYTLEYLSETQTEVTDALGHVTRYTIDKSKGRNVVTRVDGNCSCGDPQTLTWTYDDQLNVMATTDALNHTITFTYDANGNRLTQTDSSGTATFTYNQFGQVLTFTDQLSGLTTNAYDSSGNLLTSTNALGKTTSFAYDPRGLLLTMTDARGKVTSFTYDSSGNLTHKTDALGHATRFGYDLRSQLNFVVNTLGHVTGFDYDFVGRLIQIDQADGTTIVYRYDLGGRRISMTDSKGNLTSYSYDNANRLTNETDALNQTTSYRYDLMSNLSTRTDALGRVTEYEYGDFNRLKQITYPPASAGATRLFETIAYDMAGNVIQRSDTAGRVTTYAYDELNRVTTTTDAGNQVTRFEYDALGRTTAVVDALSQRYRFNYDALGQLRHIRRGATVMSFTYDAVGNRKHRTDYNGVLTVYDYDALNRLKAINYPDATTVTYSYDKLSRLQTASDQNGTIDFNYNKMNRLTTATDVYSQVLEYNYDANGNRTKLALNGSVIANYRYDAADRLTRIIDGSSVATTYDYDVTNKLISRRLPNAVLTNYEFDGLDRLTRLRDAKGAKTVADHQYQYNAANQITQIAEPNDTRAFGYDPLDRLTSVSHTNPSQGNENYVYDAVGNRTSSHLSASYSYQTFNKLTSAGGVNYSYDLNGNLTSRTDATGTWTYSWDFENRLTRVVRPDGFSVSYKYDAFGRRIQRAPSNGVSTNFVYDGDDVVKDLNSDGSTVDYVNGPGIDNKLRLTDSRLGTTGPLYFSQDQLGSTTVLTNSGGSIVRQFSYDAYGNSSGTSLTRYDYTGRERDADTGLLYYRARWYDPQVGRFISEDPIGLTGGINQFAYVGNNPQNRKDPSGLYGVDVHYYLTYYLALSTGCLSDAEARSIAQGDQDSDESDWKKPGWGNSIVSIGGKAHVVPDYAQRYRNVAFHAFGTLEQNARRAAELWSQAQSNGGSSFLLGTYLHFLQDSFSHRDFAGNDTWGQTTGGQRVDHTNFNPKKAMDMAHATFDALRKFGRRNGCECNGEPDWKVVQDFIDVGYASWNPLDFGWEISDAQLRKKITILRLPWRSRNGR